MRKRFLTLALTWLMVAALSLPLVGSTPALAGPSWVHVGPAGEPAGGVFSVGSYGDKIYTGTSNGPWRFDPPHWADATGAGPSQLAHRVNAFADAGTYLYAGTTSNGVYRSPNPGLTTPDWEKVAGGPDLSTIQAVCSTPGFIYAGGPGVWRYNGTIWFDISGAITGLNVYSLVYVSGILYAGTGSGAWRCPNPKDPVPVWTKITSGPVLNAQAMSLAYAAGSLYIGTQGLGIWRCSNPADISPVWSDMGGGFIGTDWIYSLSYAGGALYAGGSFGTMSVLRCGNPSGATPVWADTNGPSAGHPVYAMTFSSGSLYAACDVGGVYSLALQKPTIGVISPSSGIIGTEVTIDGAAFGELPGSVAFNGVPATVISQWSDSRIVCRVPAGATTGTLTVSNDLGTGGGLNFTVIPTYPNWYLAEGTTAWGFDCYVTIENPNAQQVNADITYMAGSGAVSGGTVTLPAMSQATVFPKDKLGSQDFSTAVTCREGLTIAVDRTMTWTGPGAKSPEAHNSVGVTSPANTWFLPEGSSQWGFECWLLIQNPNATPAECTVTYMTEFDGTKVVTHSVPASSRATFNMETDIGRKDASIKVECPIPVIPERAMYRNNRREGHDSIGTTSPASDYFLAEGTTAWGFTTYVLIQNPNDEANNVTVHFMGGGGGPGKVWMEIISFSMAPNTRKTIRVNDVENMGNVDCSTVVHGEKPIIAERAMYWGANTALGEACHDSIGMASAHKSFYLPDGQTSEGRETWTLVQNPNNSDVIVDISYLTPTGQGNQTFSDTVPANSRKTYNMVDKVPSSRAAVMVTSQSLPIMVERAMYWNNRGAGTDTIGGYSD